MQRKLAEIVVRYYIEDVLLLLHNIVVITRAFSV